MDTIAAKDRGSHHFSQLIFDSPRYNLSSALANAGVSQTTRVKFNRHSSNAMNDGCAKLARKPGVKGSKSGWLTVWHVSRNVFIV